MVAVRARELGPAAGCGGAGTHVSEPLKASRQSGLQRLPGRIKGCESGLPLFRYIYLVQFILGSGREDDHLV